MLSPYDRPIVLLPQDRQLIAILGCTEAEYRAFLRECAKRSQIQPGDPVNFELITGLIFFAVGLVLSLIASIFFKPKSTKGPDIRQTSVPGQNVVGRTEFAPKAGFDSLQNVVELGSTIPLVYACRETIDGVTYGGIRVNTNMLWSQMQSQGGSQMLRALFLISEGPIEEVDPSQFAFGNNVLGGYDLATANDTSSRVTFYLALNGGRIQSADRVAGRLAANDPGNAENFGGGDVFQILGLNNEWTTDFSYAYKPNTQTRFGVYLPMGNGLAYRVNPTLRPAVQVKTQPSGDDGDIKIKCNPDGVAKAQRDKYNTLFSCRSGFTELNGITPSSGLLSLAVGDIVTYTLSNTSDVETKFIGAQVGEDHEETCRDVGQTVSGRQRSWDDALTIGDLYKLGSALLICESRTPLDEIFVSDADQDPSGGGIPVDVNLRVVRAGQAELNPITGTETGTSTSHLFKVALASFAVPRSTQVVEIGLRSLLGLRISGLCNFRDSLSHTEIDGKACEYYKNKVYGPKESLELSSFQSGTYSGSETRYSFFRLGYRIAGSDSDYTYMDTCFGTRSLTQQATYNFIRLQMPSVQRWEFRLEPLSGWEIRANVATGNLEVLDARIGTAYRIVASNGVVAYFTGEPVDRSVQTFSIAATRDQNLGVTLSDTGDYADAWGKLAETFVYEELQSSARDPEHEVVYVNTLSVNPSVPTYEGIGLVGMNLRSSTEFSQLSQLSVYVNKGIKGIHTFPEVAQDMLENTTYGAGSLISNMLIDYESFSAAAAWTRERKYFFDGAVPGGINFRQWASLTASYFLLDFVVQNGSMFTLQPSFEFDKPEEITALYTAGNILPDSFQLSYADAEARLPRRVSVKWRQEKASTDESSKGLFPVIREVTVSISGTPEDAPIEAVDLTDFCTSEEHAIDVGKYLALIPVLITHAIRFKTVPAKTALQVGRCFKLGLETVSYQQPNNGGIDRNGNITSVEPLADGTYTVLLWNGKTSTTQEVELVVTNSRANAYPSSVFCIKQSNPEVRAYKVQSLGFDDDGNIDVEATYFPLLPDGYSAFTENWYNDEYWEIEGRLTDSEAGGEATSQFNGVDVIGPATLLTDVSGTYSAIISGDSGAYTYAWSGTGLTIGTPTAPSTTVSSAIAGTYTLTCTVTRNGVSYADTITIEVTTAPVATTIGTISIAGSTSVSANTPTNYTASYTGDATSPRYNWGWDSANNSASGTVLNSSSVTATFNFTVAGTYDVYVSIVSTGATDSPKEKTITVTVT